MKQLLKIFVPVIVVALLMMLLATTMNRSEGYAGSNTLTIYNWGDYIDPSLITKFEKETGMKVIYQTFDSNEAMMTKIEQGGTTFDIAVPSDYAISKMKEDLLIPLDHSKLPNEKYLDPRFMDLSFDDNNKYSMPYFWGTLGIIYNKKMFPDKNFDTWDALFDPDLKNQILLIDGAREVMGLGLNSLGYSLNDTNKAHLMEARDKLETMTPNVKAIVGDEIKLLMADNEAGVAVTFSGEAAEMLSENEDLEYMIPKDGSNLWFDNMVIPKTAKNVDGAHKFINFMLKPENAAINAEYVGYATPNEKAVKLLPKEISSDERFYPNMDELTNLEVYDNLGKRMLSYYNELFLEFKMYRK
ncbi:spermidine/putrescine ABC transporter substrate-binding protein [Listeria ivanovii]|uniref:ABC transporter substrate-binding protein n=1 Tax=Listeria ivanovii TaxID=1638 RepID=UPI000DA95977|nr:ABC transporter substrate-binding protein [Listeria ivanovii]PZG35631.1 spermidine/putrescine ABC transporter substrate-binding protein [Listeria ivanovii]PZG49478.1 spermidine/putrescine ABC transporter substrate-binding protein [Listeria ivanovii]PZH13588.1 spermidine/putrescine ABC transporter substrate-binding protein [Listeria ivanovii]